MQTNCQWNAWRNYWWTRFGFRTWRCKQTSSLGATTFTESNDQQRVSIWWILSHWYSFQFNLTLTSHFTPSEGDGLKQKGVAYTWVFMVNWIWAVNSVPSPTPSTTVCLRGKHQYNYLYPVLEITLDHETLYNQIWNMSSQFYSVHCDPTVLSEYFTNTFWLFPLKSLSIHKIMG